ncbi:OLC1v1015218C1 [Oldenlandia corymbosa var. corymbosa]|uniref:OLC1v1015218C1 n=1 Tax=Oldenlandia corymbosa var. corymbosa TaxID=529605 RepID=A0AAV1E2N9_OLDCO|nr:OLC1v1015218C1 [Oldenlandia corymbosa var. corymbosa]
MFLCLSSGIPFMTPGTTTTLTPPPIFRPTSCPTDKPTSNSPPGDFPTAVSFPISLVICVVCSAVVSEFLFFCPPLFYASNFYLWVLFVGINWLVLAAKYAGLPLIPPYFQSSYHQFGYGVNFASGGGGALVETYQGLAIDLKMQLLYFKDVEKQLRERVGDKETQKLMSNAVYMFSIGGNDLIAPNPIFSSFSSQDYIHIIIGNFTSVLKEIYKAGGRKFGLLSLVPVGCLPYIRVHNGDGSELCVEEFTKLVNQYNDALSEAIHQLQNQLQGFIYSKFDLYNAVFQRIQNPSKYGFKDVKSGCCGSGIYRANYTCGGKRGEEQEYEVCDHPEDHFFFDSYHPSEKAYNQLSKLMWDGPPSVTSPYTLKALFQLGDSASAHITQQEEYLSSDIPEFCEEKN